MRELAIVGCWVAGSLVGCVAGVWLGFREDRGSDFPMAPAFYAPAGAAFGGAVGTVAGVVLFA